MGQRLIGLRAQPAGGDSLESTLSSGVSRSPAWNQTEPCDLGAVEDGQLGCSESKRIDSLKWDLTTQ